MNLVAGRLKVSNAGVTSLCERCPLLEYLGMASLKHVTDIGVARLGSSCTRLTHLDLSGIVNLSDGMQRDFALTGIQVMTHHATCTPAQPPDNVFCRFIWLCLDLPLKGGGIRIVYREIGVCLPFENIIPLVSIIFLFGWHTKGFSWP